MKVLIVEDDLYKREAVEELLAIAFTGCNIAVCKSVQTTVVRIGIEDFDLIILDMSLPSHDPETGGALGIPRLSGGVEVLFELDYLKKDPKVVVLTQYPEIEMSNQLIPLDQVIDFVLATYGVKISSCIYFDFDNVDWKNEFIEGVTEE